MSDQTARGALRPGWSAIVDDYAIAGDWALNGALLVVGDAAGSVFGFEGTSGTIRWQKRALHSSGLLAMAMHPDGDRFATAGQDGQVHICGADDGAVRHTIDLGRGWVEHLAWSSDGNQLAAAMSRRVYVSDASGTLLWQSDDHPSTVSALAWSGAEQLATACYGRVSFFEATSGELAQKLEWKGSLVSLILSPDGDIVACGSQDNSVHFWRRSTGEDSMMHGYPGKPSNLSFDQSGSLLATGGGKTVTVWNFAGSGPEGTRPGELEMHVQPITALSFAHQGRRIASGGRDGGVVAWSLQSGGNGVAIGAAFVGELIGGLAWRPDDRCLAAFDASGGVTVWRIHRQ
ncbi:MAG: hypothetical protein CL927_04995 [Deltaproteobacteria bacterium]|nr:hypothetical protein [Deltaproteobacteria bacterium]HCH65451.1 hypothetical protein [Deltaproteobacteria bacterium]